MGALPSFEQVDADLVGVAGLHALGVDVEDDLARQQRACVPLFTVDLPAASRSPPGPRRPPSSRRSWPWSGRTRTPLPAGDRGRGRRQRARLDGGAAALARLRVLRVERQRLVVGGDGPVVVAREQRVVGRAEQRVQLRHARSGRRGHGRARGHRAARRGSVAGGSGRDRHGGRRDAATRVGTAVGAAAGTVVGLAAPGPSCSARWRSRAAVPGRASATAVGAGDGATGRRRVVADASQVPTPATSQPSTATPPATSGAFERPAAPAPARPRGRVSGRGRRACGARRPATAVCCRSTIVSPSAGPVPAGAVGARTERLEAGIALDHRRAERGGVGSRRPTCRAGRRARARSRWWSRGCAGSRAGRTRTRTPSGSARRAPSPAPSSGSAAAPPYSPPCGRRS